MASFEFQKQSLSGLLEFSGLVSYYTEAWNMWTMHVWEDIQQAAGRQLCGLRHFLLWGCGGHMVDTQSVRGSASRRRTQWAQRPALVLKARGGDTEAPLLQQALHSTQVTQGSPAHPPSRSCSGTGLYPRGFPTCTQATNTPEQLLSLHGTRLSGLYVVLEPTPGNICESTLRSWTTESQGGSTLLGWQHPPACSG